MKIKKIRDHNTGPLNRGKYMIKNGIYIIHYLREFYSPIVCFIFL